MLGSEMLHQVYSASLYIKGARFIALYPGPSAFRILGPKLGEAVKAPQENIICLFGKKNKFTVAPVVIN